MGMMAEGILVSDYYPVITIKNTYHKNSIITVQSLGSYSFRKILSCSLFLLVSVGPVQVFLEGGDCREHILPAFVLNI